jgi:hypothetical protein
MANISLYISGQTELNDVAEFFQKRLIGEGETPIAFFDGVFYESHQERVGNIVYQDYLVYSDRAIYLWARGASKDYLDRFSLGAVSVNSRNKDSSFATMNLKIRREAKEPIYVIFDMVEIGEADKVVKLQTVVESIIEDYLGVNYRQEIPQDTADRIFQAARNICPPRALSIQHDTPQVPGPDAGIGYGQDILEQYRASTGYGNQQQPYPPYQPPGTSAGERPRSGMGPQDAMRGLESMLPTDPASLKRIADQIRGMVGQAPFKLRDQVMKDLQHVPGDLATVLTALNELLANIAGNPLAERFVMNAIKTAVVNDGVIGSLGKIIKMTGIGGGGGKKSARPQAHEPAREDQTSSRPRRSPIVEEPDDDASTIRRKKISIKDDDDHSADDLFAGSDEPITSRESRPPVSRSSAPDDDDFGAGSGVRRKKLSIQMEDDNEIARKLMSYDESERETQRSAPVVAPSNGSGDNNTGIRRKKLSIKAEDGSGAEAEIARKLMSYDEDAERGVVNSSLHVDVPENSGDDEQPEPEAPRKKKIQINAETEPEPKAFFENDLESEPESEPEPEVPVRKKIRIAEESSSMPELSLKPEPEQLPEPEVEPEVEEPIVKKIRIAAEVEPELEVLSESEPTVEAEEPVRDEIRIESEPEEFDIPEDVVFAALGEAEMAEGASDSIGYMTIESDAPALQPVNESVNELVSEKKSEQHRHPSGKAGRGKRRGRKV